ncbi:glycosyltransferase 87 family protein [Citricoccus nitrophenolicus]
MNQTGPAKAAPRAGSRAGTRAGGPDRRLLLVLVGATLLAAVVAVLSKQWCRLNGWEAPGVHIHMCYSDFGQLFPTRGLAEGYFPFFTPLPEDQWMEYPALLAVVAGVTSWFVPQDGTLLERTVTYFDINAVGALLCWLIVVVATAYTARGRSKDALMVAVAPGIILTSFLNWDLWAVMLAALGLLLWSRSHPVLAGVALGLGAAMKLYPLFFFGAILVLCWRAGKLGIFFKSLAAGAVAWLAVNVPFMLTAFDQWSRFYTFSGDREVSFSSMWLAFTWTGWSGETFSLVSNGLFALSCLGIAYLGLSSRHRPRMAQLCLLIVAAFILLGKVYSPQFVMWLIPLVVLARPNWRQFWIWQAVEVYHWGGVWMESARITSEGAFGGGALWIPLWYGSGIVLHMAAVIWICVSVIRDILDPDRDPIRRSAAAGASRDPASAVTAAPGVTVAPGATAEASAIDATGEVSLPPYDPSAGVLAEEPDRFLLPPTGRGRVLTG